MLTPSQANTAPYSRAASSTYHPIFSTSPLETATISPVAIRRLSAAPRVEA